MNSLAYAPAADQALAAAAAAQMQQQQPIIPAFTPSDNINSMQQQPQAAVAPPVAQAAHQQPPQPQQSTGGRSAHSLPCTRCGYPNCDVRILGCNCLLHARCCPVPIHACPNPRCFNSNPNQQQGGGGVHPNGAAQQQALELLPMEFAELDEARRVADLAAKASWRAKEKNRARKKAKLDSSGGQGSASSSLDGKDDTPEPPPPPIVSSELRTGRWTSEETQYCDRLINKFMSGRLPLPEGIKLNEFLSNMLKSKQSRLTKKMKNAKLSSKTFKRTSGYLTDVMEAREFSESEDGFFHSLQNGLERSEIKFHMQKEWRETFSTYCVSHGQMLNIDAWLASVEEMERRVHRAKDAERMQRRKMMMGHALRRDVQNPDRGVVIEKQPGAPMAHQAGNQLPDGSFSTVPDPMVSATAPTSEMSAAEPMSEPSFPQSQSMASPFLHKIMAYVHRHQVPFEYMDAWVPSFVPDAGEEPPASENSSLATGADTTKEEKAPKCRLCFAGSMVAKQVIVGDPSTGQPHRAVPMSADDQFNLAAFGDYSESFSFDVGCGLPGRVYHMGVPTWEQSVHNAPLHHFERVGGSVQWGIRTVVGIPVPSPNVGRVVVVLYSRHDRGKDHDLVIRLTEEFTRLMPSPKWKLVVDVGQQQLQQQPTQETVVTQQQQQQMGQQGQSMGAQQQPSNGEAAPAPPDPAALTSEVISIFGEHMPSDPSSPAFAYLQGFMSLRLLLLRASRSDHEQDIVNTILSSYSSYKAGGRTRPDIALMLARDFMFLSNQQQQQVAQQQPQQQQQHNSHNQSVQQSFAPAPFNGSSNNLDNMVLQQQPPMQQQQFLSQRSPQQLPQERSVTNLMALGDSDSAQMPPPQDNNTMAATQSAES